MRRSLLCLLLALLPTSATAVVRLDAGTVDAEPGERASIQFRLRADDGEPVATVTNDLSFDPEHVRIPALPEGGADCAVESDIPHFLSAFLFQPSGCSPAAGECTGVRALVALFELEEPPLTPRTLYRCNVEVLLDTPPEEYPIGNSHASYSTADGSEGPVEAADGVVVVGRDRIPTRTPTPIEPTPRRTPPVLDPRCTGDCDASGDVDAQEQSGLLAALFDGDELDACTGTPPSVALRATAAHLLRAVRARVQGCVGRATPTRTRPPATETPTRTPSLPAADTPTSAPQPSRTATRAPTITRTPSHTRTPRPSATPTRTRARTPSATATPTRVPRTATPTPASGPQVTFAGIARADGRLVSASGEIDGAPLYELASGTGFHLVVEGRPGATLSPLGRITYAPGEMPDLQVVVGTALGDGSARVCSGGVPGFAPPTFDDGEEIIDAINDLGCHFEAGTCVLFNDGHRGYVVPQSTIQFCGLMGAEQRFARGETEIHIRLRDRNRITGDVARMVVRIGD